MLTITTDEAEDVLYGDALVARQGVSKHRWYTKELVVYAPPLGAAIGAELLGFYYLNPATEEQEGMDVFEGDPVPVFPVVAREITTTVYEAA